MCVKMHFFFFTKIFILLGYIIIDTFITFCFQILICGPLMGKTIATLTLTLEHSRGYTRKLEQMYTITSRITLGLLKCVIFFNTEPYNIYPSLVFAKPVWKARVGTRGYSEKSFQSYREENSHVPSTNRLPQFVFVGYFWRSFYPQNVRHRTH